MFAITQTLPGVKAADASIIALQSGIQAEIKKHLAGGPPACMCTSAALGHAMPFQLRSDADLAQPRPELQP
jgi:hypothetical protein